MDVYVECVYVDVYIYTSCTRDEKKEEEEEEEEFPRGFFCALRKFVWRVA